MQRFFCDPILCYLGFVVVISNTQIVQWTWLCPPDRLPVIRVVILSHLKVRVFRTGWRSQRDIQY